MGRLKLAFVLDDTLDTPDGVQQYVLTLGSWMAAQGHEVHYLVGQTTRTDIPNVHPLSRNVAVKFNGNRMSTPLPANRRGIRKLLEREKFDVLHVQIPYSPFMAQRVIMAAPKATAVIGTFHIAPHSTMVTMGNRLLGWLLKKSLNRFDTIFSVSKAAAEFAKQTYAIESAVLPNVVEAARFMHAAPMQAAKPKQIPRIVFVGRLVPRKGCMVLLEAVKELRNDPGAPEFETIICGKGPLGAELQKYTSDNDLDARVTFTGFVTEEQKASYLKSADLAVFPSTGGESFGIVLIEAMAADRPVVLGAANDGYKTVLAPSPESLIPVADACALAEKIRQFLTDDALRQKTLLWQQLYVRQFDVAVVGPRLIARYGQALRSKSNMR